MSEIDWEQEHRRFMGLVYNRTMNAAKRAFWGWHPSNRDDAIAECVAKVWDSWSRCVKKGKNPEPMTSAMIKFGVLWVKYDRRIAGRARRPDVFDFRANMKKQMLSEQGQASPTDRSDAGNSWIDWNQHTGDDPAELAISLEETGVRLEEWLDL